MLKNAIRELPLEELALVSGGARLDTTDLPPLDALPPVNDGLRDIDPPKWSNPHYPGGGGGDGRPPSAYELVDGQAAVVARDVEPLIKSDPGYQSQELGTVYTVMR